MWTIAEGSLEVKLPTIWADEKQRWEESEKRRTKSIKKRKSQKIEDGGVRKGGKSVFPMICGSGGSKSRLAKAAGAEPSGQMRDEKLHAVVARSRNWRLGALLEVEMSKKCTPLWREAHVQVKMYKAHHAWTTFGSSHVEKVYAVVARSTCQKLTGLDVQMSFLRGRRKGLCTLSKVSQAWGFCSISKNYGRRGAFAEDLQRCISRGRCSTRDMFIRDVRRLGRWFPEKRCILEHQIVRFAKMILRDRCSTSYDLAWIFCGRRSTLDRWSGKNAKRIGTRPSALHYFLFLKEVKASILTYFDVVKFKNWISLAELLRFWCCQVQKLRNSRRIASFSTCR